MMLGRIREEQTARVRYVIEGTHQWGLPGVHCPTCGKTWAMTGVSYPAVDLSGLRTVHAYEEARAEPLDVFLELQGNVRHLVPEGLPLPPGSGFGRFSGIVRGSDVPQLCFANPWNVMSTPEARQLLIDKGIHLPISVEAWVTGMPPSRSLVEYQIEAWLHLAPDSFGEQASLCAGCGRLSDRPKELIIDPESVPAEGSLLRIAEHPTYIIATRELFDAAQELGTKTLTFEPLTIAA